MWFGTNTTVSHLPVEAKNKPIAMDDLSARNTMQNRQTLTSVHGECFPIQKKIETGRHKRTNKRNTSGLMTADVIAPVKSTVIQKKILFDFLVQLFFYQKITPFWAYIFRTPQFQ